MNTIVHGNSGLVNRGNTCYFNSAIQAISHTYYFRQYLFENQEGVMKKLLKNAPRIFKDVPDFDEGLKVVIMNPNYDYTQLSEEQMSYILNRTMTYQMLKMLKFLWKRNNIFDPVSLRKIFSQNRGNFFEGYSQHDAEEAYSSIIQKIHEELIEKENLSIRKTLPNLPHVQPMIDLLRLMESKKNSKEEHQDLEKNFNEMKFQHPLDAMIATSHKEIEGFYSNNYSILSRLMTGFFNTITICPMCKYFSTKTDPYWIIPLSINSFGGSVSIYDCMDKYSEQEVLDKKNLWKCDKCGERVQAIKKMEVWITPNVLVFQLKRFDFFTAQNGATVKRKNNAMVKYPFHN